MAQEAVGQVGVGAGAARTGRLRRDIGMVGLMFSSLGAIIGSGWLFGALYAAQAAGPAALISWVLAGGGVMLLALIHAELGAMFPVAGGTARFPHYAFGGLAGFTAGWVMWIGSVTVAPIEVEALLQYSSNYINSGNIGNLTYTAANGSVVLTALGYAVAAVLMLAFTVINLIGVRWLSHTNNVVMIWKIAIPVLTAIVLLFHFHGGNLSAAGGFAPFGAKGVLSAIAVGGVIFALLGFEQAVQMAGESSNPGRNVPIAVIGAMLIGVVLYLVLQLSFLGALRPSDLTHGWASLGSGDVLFGPFAGLATAIGLGWLATLLYTDAIISPGGTGLIYTASSSRVSYALARNGYVPGILGKIGMRDVPVWSIVFSFIVGMIVFLPFPGWQQLVGFISEATVVGYGVAPLALGALRRQLPEQERPYRLPMAGVLSPLGFVVANLIVYWTGWTVTWKLLVAIAAGFALLLIAQVTNRSERRAPLDWEAAMWLVPWLGGMGLISYFGQFDGRGDIPFWWDMALVTAFSIAVYAIAIQARLEPHRVEEHVEQASREHLDVADEQIA
ncbi:MAG TPA: APC family permease [Gaiellales bacterium]|jgi:amino acid transporter